MAKHDVWMHELYFTLLNADFAYPTAVALDVDPVISSHFSNPDYVGVPAYFALAKMIGCAVVAEPGKLTVVGRETNLAFYDAASRKLQAGRPVWKTKTADMRWWSEYDDDFDVPVEDRRSTILKPQRDARIALEAVAWAVCGLFPQLRDYRTKSTPRLKPSGGHYRLGGVLPS